MPDRVSPGPLSGNQIPREAVCIHTKKVYDSCREKDIYIIQKLGQSPVISSHIELFLNKPPLYIFSTAFNAYLLHFNILYLLALSSSLKSNSYYCFLSIWPKCT